MDELLKAINNICKEYGVDFLYEIEKGMSDLLILRFKKGNRGLQLMINVFKIEYACYGKRFLDEIEYRIKTELVDNIEGIERLSLKISTETALSFDSVNSRLQYFISKGINKNQLESLYRLYGTEMFIVLNYSDGMCKEAATGIIEKLIEGERENERQLQQFKRYNWRT